MAPLRGDAGDPGPGGRARGPAAENGTGAALCTRALRMEKKKNNKKPKNLKSKLINEQAGRDATASEGERAVL